MTQNYEFRRGDLAAITGITGATFADKRRAVVVALATLARRFAILFRSGDQPSLHQYHALQLLPECVVSLRCAVHRLLQLPCRDDPVGGDSALQLGNDG